MLMFDGAECMTAGDLLSRNGDNAAKGANKNSNKVWGDVTLYHGSRGGIDGDRPNSRVRCDFGKGFYMGDNPEQIKSLVVDAAAPVFYKITFKLSEIPDNKILVLEGEDWINAVLANRKCPEFSQLKLAKHWLKELDKYDVVIAARNTSKTARRGSSVLCLQLNKLPRASRKGNFVLRNGAPNSR